MAAPTVTYTFSNGTTSDATEVNTNFTDILNAMTDGNSDFSIGALTVAGTFTANGACTLGNSTTDDITITGSLSSSIPVKTADSYDIGSAALGLNAIYFGDNSNSVGIKADASASADWVWSFPPAAGTKGYVPYDSDGAGDIQWAPIQHDINSVSSANYTILDNDGYRHIHVTTGSTSRSITLPAAANNTDRIITIRKVDSGTGGVNVLRAGSDSIEGTTIQYVDGQYAVITVISDGSSWFILDYRAYFTGTADNDYTGGTIYVTRVGKLVTVEWSSLTHASDTNPLTSTSFLPIWSAPSQDTNNCYHTGTNGTQLATVATGRTLQTRYFNTSFATDSRTSAQNGSFTYRVA